MVSLAPLFRCFFFPYSGDTCYSKSDTLAAVINFGMASETTFQKRMFFNIPSGLLRSLLGQLVDEVQIPEDTSQIRKAVHIMGKIIGRGNEPVWVLNKSLTISKFGAQVDLSTHGVDRPSSPRGQQRCRGTRGRMFRDIPSVYRPL